MLSLALLGGALKLSQFSVFFLYFFFQFFVAAKEELHYEKGVRARNLVDEHQHINEFF